MGANLDFIIDVNILSDAPPVSTADFDIIMLMHAGATFAASLVKTYNSPAELDADGELNAAAIAAGKFLFAQTQNPGKLKICRAGVELDYGLDLAAAYAEDPNFYAVAIDVRTDTEVEDVSTWVQTQGDKLFLAQTADADILTDTTPNILSVLAGLSNSRTLLAWHLTDLEEMALSWGAYKLSADPDQKVTSWPHVSLAGVAIDDLTSTERGNILDNNANCYLNLKGAPEAYGGKTVTGIFVDTLLSGDWLKARIEEGIATLLRDVSARNEKVPYTDAGIAQIAAVVRRYLARGEEIGHFRPGSSTVTVPLLSTIDPAIVASRELTISATTILAGAIDQAVTVNIVVTAS